MPEYTYRCLSCNTRFGRRKGMTDPHPSRCPECGVTGNVERDFKADLTGQPIYKGSGFYTTDKKLDTDPPGYNGAPDEFERG